MLFESILYFFLTIKTSPENVYTIGMISTLLFIFLRVKGCDNYVTFEAMTKGTTANKIIP